MKRSRLAPPLWLWLVWIALAGLVAWLWLGDAGDAGLRNAGTYSLATIALALGWLWFVLLSGHPGKRRAGVAAAAVVLFALSAFTLRLEGFDGSMLPEFRWRFAEPPAVSDDAVDPEVAEAGFELEPAGPDDFPGFLGPERDNAVRDVRLVPDWEAHPPELVWRRDVGAGWSAFALARGLAVTMEQVGETERVSGFRLADGERVWSHEREGGFDHFLGGKGPRSTPTIDGERVFALGVHGHLACLDLRDGTLLWERDLLGDWRMTPEREAELVQYGRSNSPLVVGDSVVVPVGGDPDVRQAGLVAFDVETGETVWEGPPRQVSFSSPQLATLAGVEQILIVNEDTVSGHAADTGELLWEHEWPGVTSASASVSQAVAVPPDRVLVSKGYGGGAMLLELAPGTGGGLEATTVWRERRALRTKLTNVAVREGFAYGLSDGILECVDLATGERAWKEGRYGHGQVLLLGAHLVVLTEEGELVLLEGRSDRAPDVLGRVQALEGKSWNHLAFSRGLLAVRNGREAAVYRLAVEGGG